MKKEQIICSRHCTTFCHGTAFECHHHAWQSSVLLAGVLKRFLHLSRFWCEYPCARGPDWVPPVSGSLGRPEPSVEGAGLQGIVRSPQRPWAPPAGLQFSVGPSGTCNDLFRYTEQTHLNITSYKVKSIGEESNEAYYAVKFYIFSEQ